MTPEELDLLERGSKAYQYRYKDGFHDGGESKHLGPMAQNLASTEIGRGMVNEGPDGLLSIDGGRAGVTALGLLSDIHSRLKAVEGAPRPVPQEHPPEVRRAFGLTGGELSPEAHSELAARNDREAEAQREKALAVQIDVDQALAAGVPPWRAWMNAQAQG